VLRWLLPILAVITLLGSSVTAWAAAGLIGDPTCCCPVKAKCKCHDHEGKPDSKPTLKRCAGEAQLVSPAVTPVVATAEVPIANDVCITIVATVVPEPIPDDRSIEPVTPPF
jgi:hypothetical protein